MEEGQGGVSCGRQGNGARSGHEGWKLIQPETNVPGMLRALHLDPQTSDTQVCGKPPKSRVLTSRAAGLVQRHSPHSSGAGAGLRLVPLSGSRQGVPSPERLLCRYMHASPLAMWRLCWGGQGCRQQEAGEVPKQGAEGPSDPPPRNLEHVTSAPLHAPALCPGLGQSPTEAERVGRTLGGK